MRKFGCLLFLMMLAMVFCPSIWGEIITEIKDGKIIMFEKTIIKTEDLPSKNLNISNEIAKELFSGQKKNIFLTKKKSPTLIFSIGLLFLNQVEK